MQLLKMTQRYVYTEEELQTYEDKGSLPEGVDLAPFAEMVAQLKQTLEELDEKRSKRRGFGFYYPRTNKPRRKRQPKEVVDNDGWTSLVPKKHAQSSAEAAAAEEKAEEFEKSEQVRSFKTNTAKISSGKTGTASTKDTVAIAHVSRFNAFDALNEEDDSDQE